MPTSDQENFAVEGDNDEATCPPLYEDMISAVDASASEDDDLSTLVSMAAELYSGVTPRPRPSRGAVNGSLSSAAIRRPTSRPLLLPLGDAADGGKGSSYSDRGRGSRMPFPLFAAEYHPSNDDPAANRATKRPSLSCVSISAADIASMAVSSSSVSRWPRPDRGRDEKAKKPMVPPLQPPNETSTAITAVHERTSFVRSVWPATQPPPSQSYPVKLHVYDLSSGLLHKYSRDILGKYVPGMYHSAIVCYGMEFYFEGGIGVAASGRTRFGNKYKTVALGSTTRPLSDFLEWVSRKETTTNQVHDYHLTRHNCHHFCDNAAEFLLGSHGLIPNYVFSTVTDLLSTDQGKAVQEVLEVTTKGTQSALAWALRLRVMERQASMDMILHAVTACGVLLIPPTVAVLFRLDDADLCHLAFKQVEPYLDSLAEKNLLRPRAMKTYRDFTNQLIDNVDTLTGHNVAMLGDLFADVLERNAITLWGPPLNALRVAILHKCVAVAVVFHARLMRLLVLGCRDFPRLLPDGRLALLRVLVNFGATTHGAVAHQDLRYASSWVSAVGQGLIDRNGAINYAAACLANNLATSIVAVTSPSLRQHMSNLGDAHPLFSLLTIALYNVNYRSSSELPEPCFNMLLMATLRIFTSTSTALQFAVHHSFRMRYADLLRRADSNESRALLCILKTVEDLYR